MTGTKSPFHKKSLSAKRQQQTRLQHCNKQEHRKQHVLTLDTSYSSIRVSMDCASIRTRDNSSHRFSKQTAVFVTSFDELESSLYVNDTWCSTNKKFTTDALNRCASAVRCSYSRVGAANENVVNDLRCMIRGQTTNGQRQEFSFCTWKLLPEEPCNSQTIPDHCGCTASQPNPLFSILCP